MKLDGTAIFRRLGEVPHDADFYLTACDQCGQQYLVDEEIMTIYLEPSLQDHALMMDPWPVCRGCGAVDWDLVAATTAQEPWRWAVATDLATD